MNIKEKRLIQSFVELVQIDSISRQERKMTDKLKMKLKELGCDVKEDNAGSKIDGNSGNIIASFGGNIKGEEEYPVLLFSAHIDRVEPGKGIKPKIENGYIYSEGETVLGADDLVGVACILETLKILKEENIPHGQLKIIFTVAEELGLEGAKNLNPDIFKGVDFGFVFDAEGSIGTIVYKGPFKAKFNAIIRGKSAHAGMEPECGVNAIKIASQAISTMKIGQIDEETTSNIGVIRGGVARNIVPDLVELEGEVRSQCENKLIEQIEHMKNIIRKFSFKYGGEVDFDIEQLYRGFALELESDIIKLLVKAIADNSFACNYQSSCGGSDANIFNEKGLPTANLSIGVENVHSVSESIEIASMVNLVKLNLSIIDNSKGF